MISDVMGSSGSKKQMAINDMDWNYLKSDYNTLSTDK